MVLTSLPSSPSVKRRGYSLRLAPSVMQASPYGFCGNSSALAPFRDGEGVAAVRDTPNVAFVASLSGSRCPTAILWAIVSVIIDTLKRMLGAGPLSHISKEIVKGLPSRAHTNAPRAVIRVRAICRILAPRLHRRPYVMGGVVRHTVPSDGSTDIGAPLASATTDVTAPERCSGGVPDPATLTSAPPTGLAVNRLIKTRYCDNAKPPTRHVFELIHDNNITARTGVVGC